jgi:hypothetical protein
MSFREYAMPIEARSEPQDTGFLVRAASRIRDLHDHARLFSDWNLRYDQISCGSFERTIREARFGVYMLEQLKPFGQNHRCAARASCWRLIWCQIKAPGDVAPDQ